MAKKDLPDLFLKATNAYKDWWMCGRDFVDHTHVWEAWDVAVKAYMKESGFNRMEAIHQIQDVLGMSEA